MITNKIKNLEKYKKCITKYPPTLVIYSDLNLSSKWGEKYESSTKIESTNAVIPPRFMKKRDMEYLLLETSADAKNLQPMDLNELAGLFKLEICL